MFVYRQDMTRSCPCRPFSSISSIYVHELPSFFYFYANNYFNFHLITNLIFISLRLKKIKNTGLANCVVKFDQSI